MAIVTCTSCGAQLDDTSRFCRSCGKPFDPSELTTRKLEPEVQYQSPTQTVNQWPTTPAYLAPVQAPPVPATNDLTPGSKNRTVIVLLAATVGLLLFLLVAMVLVNPEAFSTKSQRGSTAGGGNETSIPRGTGPGAPEPPEPPAVGKSVVDESLKYPGAEELMSVKSGQGKGMLQLQTKDAASKVVEWYTAKLKPTEQVKLPFGNAILRSGDIAVVISGNEDGTSILITQGEDGAAAPQPPR